MKTSHALTISIIFTLIVNATMYYVAKPEPLVVHDPYRTHDYVTFNVTTRTEEALVLGYQVNVIIKPIFDDCKNGSHTNCFMTTKLKHLFITASSRILLKDLNKKLDKSYKQQLDSAYVDWISMTFNPTQK